MVRILCEICWLISTNQPDFRAFSLVFEGYFFIKHIFTSYIVIKGNFEGGQIPQKSRDKDVMWNCLNLMTLSKKVYSWALSMAGFEYGMTSSENHIKIGLKTDVSIQSFRILSSKNYLHALKLLAYKLEVFEIVKTEGHKVFWLWLVPLTKKGAKRGPYQQTTYSNVLFRG